LAQRCFVFPQPRYDLFPVHDYFRLTRNSTGSGR
jgi:hypothetical protein